MKNTNTRNIILLSLIVAILGAGVLYFNTNNTEVVLNKEKQEQIDIIPEFGGVTEFVKKDLTEGEKEDLKIILEQRKDRQVQIKDILDEAYEKGDMEEAWIQVAEMRNKCKGRILPFISESEVEAFENYCILDAERLEADYVQK